MWLKKLKFIQKTFLNNREIRENNYWKDRFQVYFLLFIAEIGGFVK